MTLRFRAPLLQRWMVATVLGMMLTSACTKIRERSGAAAPRATSKERVATPPRATARGVTVPPVPQPSQAEPESAPRLLTPDAEVPLTPLQMLEQLVPSRDKGAPPADREQAFVRLLQGEEPPICVSLTLRAKPLQLRIGASTHTIELILDVDEGEHVSTRIFGYATSANSRVSHGQCRHPLTVSRTPPSLDGAPVFDSLHECKRATAAEALGEPSRYAGRRPLSPNELPCWQDLAGTVLKLRQEAAQGASPRW